MPTGSALSWPRMFFDFRSRDGEIMIDGLHDVGGTVISIGFARVWHDLVWHVSGTYFS